MRALSGAPQFLPSQLPYADFARLIGLDGVRVEKAADVEAAWRRAGPWPPTCLRHRVSTDPAVPPIPPRAEGNQITATASSILKGSATESAWGARDSNRRSKSSSPDTGTARILPDRPTLPNDGTTEQRTEEGV